jgi:hypothetical protein
MVVGGAISCLVRHLIGPGCDPSPLHTFLDRPGRGERATAPRWQARPDGTWSAASRGPWCFWTVSCEGGAGSGSSRSPAQEGWLSWRSCFFALIGARRGPSVRRRRRDPRSPARRTGGRTSLRQPRPKPRRSARRLPRSRAGTRRATSRTGREPRQRGRSVTRRYPRTRPPCGCRRARVRSPCLRRCEASRARSLQLRNHSRRRETTSPACSSPSQLQDRSRPFHRRRRLAQKTRRRRHLRCSAGLLPRGILR